jgi:hypothetical protein
VAKLWRADEKTLVFECPGCGYGHPFDTTRWTWNGSMEKPTFHPSLLIMSPAKRCHSFVRDGNIQFLNDCAHALAGKTIELPEVWP